jgi:hypothetical protein
MMSPTHEYRKKVIAGRTCSRFWPVCKLNDGDATKIADILYGRRIHEARRWARSQIPNAITTAPARVNQVVAYCR